MGLAPRAGISPTRPHGCHTGQPWFALFASAAASCTPPRLACCWRRPHLPMASGHPGLDAISPQQLIASSTDSAMTASPRHLTKLHVGRQPAPICNISASTTLINASTTLINASTTLLPISASTTHCMRPRRALINAATPPRPRRRAAGGGHTSPWRRGRRGLAATSPQQLSSSAMSAYATLPEVAALLADHPHQERSIDDLERYLTSPWHRGPSPHDATHDRQGCSGPPRPARNLRDKCSRNR